MCRMPVFLLLATFALMDNGFGQAMYYAPQTIHGRNSSDDNTWNTIFELVN